MDSEEKAIERANQRIRELEQALAEREQEHPALPNAAYAVNPKEVFLEQSAKMAHLGYAVWDDELDRDIAVSDELARIHGLSLDEYLETVSSLEKYLQLVVPEDRQHYLKHDNKLLADRSSEAKGVEYRIRRPDGEIRYIHERSQYIPVASGRPTQSIVVLQDVTDQKRAELGLDESRAALVEREAMLTQSAAMAKLGHAVWDEDAERYAAISEGWAQIFGYTQEEFAANFMASADDEKLVHPADRERYRAFLAEFADAEDVPDIEYRVVHRDGTTRHLLERHSYLNKGPAGGTRALVTIQDVTDRVARENELKAARHAAEQASQAKSSFLALMSHEIRTPLNAVLGALGLIEPQTLPAAMRDYLSLGIRGAESLLHIINDILDFSKIEAGKLQLETSAFSLRATIEDVLRVLEPLASEKSISLTWEIAPGISESRVGDASRILQVLLNLSSNALRFTDEGGVHIRVSNPGGQGDGSCVRFEVEDTGCGVSREDQAYLFEEFWGKNDAAMGGDGGTGLGLSICKRLVELMAGSIDFESVDGRGSRFWFDLPLEIAVDEAAGPDQFKAIGNGEDLPTLRGRVLLAEDNPANQLVEHAILERFGLQVDMVGNGREAVAALRNVPYDLVLMDINMPEMDGIEATAAIRKLPGELSSIPIVAMTALSMRGDRERFLSLGMDGYVSKPIVRKELHACIDRFLPDSGQSPETARSPAGAAPIDAASQLIDSGMLAKLVDDVGTELLPQIIDAYLSEMPARVDAISAAAASGDCEAVAKEAHPLKSSSANLGATVLAELARRLEHAGREGDRAQIEREMGRLSSLSGQTGAQLQRIRSDIHPSAEKRPA